MDVYIGADHNGFERKQTLITALTAAGYQVHDEGDKTPQPDDDFPQFAAQVVHAMRTTGDSQARGILICGSGQGMCMAANRFKGIRASVVWDITEARAARNDDDSNVLCLPARTLSADQAIAIAELWLKTPFAGAPRFRRRIAEIDQLG